MDISLYPLPNEGIEGTDRSGDDLLSIEEEAVPRRSLTVDIAGALYTAILVGSPAPKVAKMYDRATKPQPGDLVMEVGAPYEADDSIKKVHGFGFLIESRRERVLVDEEWFPETAWYVQYGPSPDDICRWVDARFIAIPTDRTWYE